MFGLLSSYYSVWFVVCLLRRGGVRHFVVAIYLCGGDFDKQNGFYRLKISNYSHQYVEERKTGIVDFIVTILLNFLALCQFIMLLTYILFHHI